jgi:hypothetical protein
LEPTKRIRRNKSGIQVSNFQAKGSECEVPLAAVDLQVYLQSTSRICTCMHMTAVLCAGSLTEAISMRFEDYMNAVKAFSEPVIGSFTTAEGHGQESISEA